MQFERDGWLTPQMAHFLLNRCHNPIYPRGIEVKRDRCRTKARFPESHALRVWKTGSSETRVEQGRTADGQLALNVECDNPTRILTVGDYRRDVPFRTAKGFTLSLAKQVWSGKMDHVIKTAERNVRLL